MGILRSDRITGLGGANAIKGSAHFHGGGDCGGLETEVSSDFQFGSGNFTIEVWANWSGHDSSGFATIVKSGNTNASNSMFQFDYKSSESKLRLIPYVSNSSVVKQVSFTPEFDRWYHLAAVRDGNNLKIFIDGTQTGGDLAFSDTIDSETTGLSIGKRAMSDENNGYERNFNGYLSNLRIVNGTAIYTADFTPPTNELEKTSDTVLLALQSPGNLFQEATGKKLYVAGDRANQQSVTPSRRTPNSPVGFSTTTDVGSQYGATFDGFGNFATSTYMVPPGGNTRERGRGRGVLGGGFNAVSPNNHNVISYVEVQSGGIFKDFGDLTLARSYFPAGQTSSSTRGIFAGGYGGGGGYNTIDFITIANTGNAIDFGDISVAKFGQGGLSNQTRALFGGNATAPFDNIIEFVTIATTGNAQDFGDIVEARGLTAGASSSTRGVLGGGRNNTPSSNTLKNTMEYVTFSTTGNTQDFGDLQALRYGHTGFSSPTRGIYAGGYLSPGETNSIDYFTIATLGNSIDFGDLSDTIGYCGSVTNSIRGAVTVNNAPSYYNTVEFITIATTGNATDFGDADVGSGKGHGDFPACASDSHGGLS